MSIHCHRLSPRLLYLEVLLVSIFVMFAPFSLALEAEDDENRIPSKQEKVGAERLKAFLALDKTAYGQYIDYHKLLHECLKSSRSINKEAPEKLRANISRAYHMLKPPSFYPFDKMVSERLQDEIALLQLMTSESRRKKAPPTPESGSTATPVFLSTPKIKESQDKMQKGSKVDRGLDFDIIIEDLKKQAAKDKTSVVKLTEERFQRHLFDLHMKGQFVHVAIGWRFYLGISGDNRESKLKLKENSPEYKYFNDTLGIEPTIQGHLAVCEKLVQISSKLIEQARKALNEKDVKLAVRCVATTFTIMAHPAGLESLTKAERQALLDFLEKKE